MVPGSYGETFVRISGPADDAPMVLLPGLNSPSLFWQPNVQALSAQHRTYAVERPGEIGCSVCTRPISSLAEIVGWLNDTIGALEPARPIDLVGLSYGGWLAARYALAFPNRLRKLVLLAPGGLMPTNWQFIVRALPILTGRRAAFRWFVEWLLLDVGRNDPARVELSLERAIMSYRSMRPRRLIGPVRLTDADLAGLRTPTLFLVGEHEKLYSARKAIERLKRVAPQIQTEVLPGAGHDLTCRKPARSTAKFSIFWRNATLGACHSENACGAHWASPSLRFTPISRSIWMRWRAMWTAWRRIPSVH